MIVLAPSFKSYYPSESFFFVWDFPRNFLNSASWSSLAKKSATIIAVGLFYYYVFIFDVVNYKEKYDGYVPGTFSTGWFTIAF